MDKIRNKTKKTNICAPGKGNNYTCFDKSSLIKIARQWNKKNADKIKINNSNYNLWRSINKKLINKCSNENCWLKQDFINKYQTYNKIF